MDDTLDSDPVRVEGCRRTMCTIVLMDRTLSPSLNVPCCFEPQQVFKQPGADAHLGLMRSRITGVDTVDEGGPNLIAEIFRLSQLFCQLCLYHRQREPASDLQAIERDHFQLGASLHPSLAYSKENFLIYKEKG